MPQTELMPSFTTMSDYLDSLIKYYSDKTNIERSDASQYQEDVDQPFLTEAEDEVYDLQREVLKDPQKSAEDPDLGGVFVDMESSLRLNQAMQLFMSRNVCDYLKHTDRDLGRRDE